MTIRTPVVVSVFMAALASVMVGGGASGQALSGPLSGPEVIESDPASSVRVRYDGSMESPRGAPPELAVEALELSDAERERVERVLGDRAAVFDRVVSDNWEGLLMYEGAEAEGNRRLQAAIVFGLLGSMDPLWGRGALRDELRGCLDEENAARYDEVLARFEREREVFWLREAERNDADPDLVGKRLEAAGEVLGYEIERAIERYVADGAGFLERIIDELDLTIEQEGRVRTFAADYFSEAGLDPTQEEQERFFLKVLTHLPPDKAGKLIEIARRGF